MMIIVSYDVSTESDGGKKRLRHVAKTCLNFGQRVQYSVFECQVDFAQLQTLRNDLLKEIDPASDSLRFYILGNSKAARTEHYGAKKTLNLAHDTLMI